VKSADGSFFMATKVSSYRDLRQRCGYCFGWIEFDESKIGESVECRKCGDESVLSFERAFDPRSIRQICAGCCEWIEFAEYEIGNSLLCAECGRENILKVERAYTPEHLPDRPTAFARWRCDRCHNIFEFHVELWGSSIYCPHSHTGGMGSMHLIENCPKKANSFSDSVWLWLLTYPLYAAVVAAVNVLIVYIFVKIIQIGLSQFLGDSY
jgi:phage terminase large subunit GpA-like protein